MNGMQKCCLWSNGKKVANLQQLKENFNISDVRGYYLAGTLLKWLELGGYYEYAERIAAIPGGTNPDKYLSDIFSDRVFAPPQYHKANPAAPKVFFRNFGIAGSGGSFYGSFVNGSFVTGSFVTGSFKAGSGVYYTGSGAFNIGSGGYYTGSGFYNIGSGFYNIGSYRFGSGYYEFEYEFEVGSGRSFRFRQGSGYGSFVTGSFTVGSFTGAVFGSFGAVNPIDYCESGYTETELKCYFTSEPMNLYGYGIHLI